MRPRLRTGGTVGWPAKAGTKGSSKKRASEGRWGEAGADAHGAAVTSSTPHFASRVRFCTGQATAYHGDRAGCSCFQYGKQARRSESRYWWKQGGTCDAPEPLGAAQATALHAV